MYFITLPAEIEIYLKLAKLTEFSKIKSHLYLYVP